ncbi:MAG TPA: POTRA domain-containing protein, partial [Candidatus Acidoferrales bacterium]|nr:POTRA domain-containing protein [Candidatus Acidoferrales bacterium]
MEGAILVTVWMLALWLAPPRQAPQSPTPPASSPAIAAEQHTAHFEEQRVVAVRVVSESGEVIMENPVELAQQAGQSYHSEAVRESLRQLYRSGRYADVRTEAANVTGGVRLDFVVQPNFYVNSVHVSGLKEPPNESQALAALQLGLGEAFRERALRDALERLQEALRDDGFHQATLDVERKETPATQQMDLLVRVTPGARARIGEVT